MAMILDFFSPAPRGLEGPLANELTALGAESVVKVPGGVAYRGDDSLVYQANLHSRIATRVLLKLAESDYRCEDDIYNLVVDTNWPDWFDVDKTIKVSISAIRCPLRSLDFLTLRIKDAICDRFRADLGSRPSVEVREPDVRIHAFIDDRRVIVYIDTSGPPLYKRTGRPGTHKAPLKENLAAGIVKLTGWNPETPLLDPMCGGGTFLIEAAQIALNIAPGHLRSFAFERFLGFDQALWSETIAAARAAERPRRLLDIVGSDRFGKVLRTARLNLEAADLAGCVDLKQASLLELRPPFESATMIMNPPYGVRLTEIDDLDTFYSDFGTRLKQCYDGYQAWILSPDMALPDKIRLRPKRRIPVFNGNIECRLFGFEIVSGSFRRVKPDSSSLADLNSLTNHHDELQ